MPPALAGTVQHARRKRTQLNSKTFKQRIVDAKRSLSEAQLGTEHLSNQQLGHSCTSVQKQWVLLCNAKRSQTTSLQVLNWTLNVFLYHNEVSAATFKLQVTRFQNSIHCTCQCLFFVCLITIFIA